MGATLPWAFEPKLSGRREVPGGPQGRWRGALPRIKTSKNAQRIPWYFLALRSTRDVTAVVTAVVVGCATERELLESDAGENIQSSLESWN